MTIDKNPILLTKLIETNDMIYAYLNKAGETQLLDPLKEIYHDIYHMADDAIKLIEETTAKENTKH